MRRSPRRSRRDSAPTGVAGQATIAEGIAITRPARGAQILAAVRDSGGTIVGVTEDQIRTAHAGLARAGLYVEPTAAVCWAAIEAGSIAAPSEPGLYLHTVAPLCGSGLKSNAPRG